MLKFHWGGQVSADIQAQNQMLFDAMAPEEQQRVLAAQSERAAAEHAATTAAKSKLPMRCGLVVLGFVLVAVGGWVGLLIAIAIGVGWERSIAKAEGASS